MKIFKTFWRHCETFKLKCAMMGFVKKGLPKAR